MTLLTDQKVGGSSPSERAKCLRARGTYKRGAGVALLAVPLVRMCRPQISLGDTVPL